MFAAFVMLGLPEGVLGTAWPSIRSSFDRPESALATLLIAYTGGYFVSTLGSGRLSERISTSQTTRVGVLLTAVGLLAHAVSPVWAVSVIASLALGSGAGFVDASINAEVALRYDQRTMNLLHGAFGVGATFGPLLVTTLALLDASWRFAYLLLMAIEVVILIGLAPSAAAPASQDADDMAVFAAPARRPNLALASTLLWFAVYVGTEVSVGQWSYSILTEQRGVGTSAAGLAVAAYWGGLTVGRLALGVLGNRLSPLVLLRVSVVVAVVGAAWFWQEWAGSLVALPILGLAFAGMFPAVVLLGSSWLGAERLERAVGYQLSASSGGAIVAAAALGLLADRQGLAVLGGALMVLAAALFVATMLMQQAAR